MTNDAQKQFLPEIRIGKIGILKVHQISDDELKTLSAGSPSSLCLNFGISLISIGSSFLISLITIDIINNRVFQIFFMSTLCCFIIGIILMCFWLRLRRTVSNLVKDIRNRMPPEGEAEPIDQSITTPLKQ